MAQRYRTMGEQLGKRITSAGAHMPSAVVGLIRKKRTKKAGMSENLKGGSKVKPINADPPYPFEFSPSS